MPQLTEEQILDLKEAFAIFDVNGDGKVSRKELTEMMRASGQNPTDAEVSAMIAEVDGDADGFVQYSEFEEMMANHGMKTEQEQKDELKEAFKVFDRDGNGYITADELRHTMTTLGEKFTDDEIESMMEAADRDRNGRIYYEEFAEMMARK